MPSCVLRAVGCPPLCRGAAEACQSLTEVGIFCGRDWLLLGQAGVPQASRSGASGDK